MSNDSTAKTFIVALSLCVVCSIIVSVSAVGLRDTQNINKALDKKKNILNAAGIDIEGKQANEIKKIYLASIEAKLVDFATGDYVKTEEGEADKFDQRKAAKDPAQSVVIENDNTGIGRRSKTGTVYLVKDKEGKTTRVILPVHGKGLWSTLYGFLAIDIDLNTIKALGFYAHAETPGLGGEVDNPKWKKLWNGKKIYNAAGDLKINVIKGVVTEATPEAEHKVDGLAGATITARGVGNMLQYWLGDGGFGKYLDKLRESK